MEKYEKRKLLQNLSVSVLGSGDRVDLSHVPAFPENSRKKCLMFGDH